jgi:signal transduction histidine kinase
MKLERDDGRLRLRLRCHGVVPDEVRPYLFAKFVQVDANTARFKSGADVGLGLAKTIVEHLGGTIGVGADTVYTTFTIELPEVDRRAE